MFWIWFIVAVAFLIIEALTVDLVSVWFAASALIMGVVAAIFPELDVWWGIGIFVALSFVLVLSTRKLVKKFFKRKKGQETNLELNIGHTAIVVEEIDNLHEKGSVKINGLIWTARSENGEVIEEGALVVFKSISGNKAFVERKK
jgi:membrane protein implicated in regulation of membrane protease activity